MIFFVALFTKIGSFLTPCIRFLIIFFRRVVSEYRVFFDSMTLSIVLFFRLIVLSQKWPYLREQRDEIHEKIKNFGWSQKWPYFRARKIWSQFWPSLREQRDEKYMGSKKTILRDWCNMGQIWPVHRGRRVNKKNKTIYPKLHPDLSF